MHDVHPDLSNLSIYYMYIIYTYRYTSFLCLLVKFCKIYISTIRDLFQISGISTLIKSSSEYYKERM